MKLNIEYFDSTEELLKGSFSGNSPNSPNGSNSSDVRDLNNLNLLVRADTSDIAADTATDSGGAANNDELLIYQFQRDFFFEKSKELPKKKQPLKPPILKNNRNRFANSANRVLCTAGVQ